MRLIDDLLASVRLHDSPAKRACLGPNWAVVESRYTGIAHALNAAKHSAGSADELIGTGAFELAQFIRSDILHEAGLGVAALNSLIETTGRPGNIFAEIFGMIGGKTVTVVGRFPIYEEIAKVAGRAYLLEMEPEEGELPASDSQEVIPSSDIVVISGTALINKTLPRLLELCTLAKAKAFIIGPSTPMSDVLLQHGAYRLGGMRVVDTDALIESVTAGAGSSKELAGIELIVRP
ncbi:MAG: Rossmann-like domain-containing protein [Candidatus Thorarchaeota archaeon]